jgi:hypothetical protein
MSRLKVTRSAILFVVGLGGILYETLAEHADRPTLLLLFAAMVGLPAFLRVDEKKSAPPSAKDDEPP